ncbi:MAG: 50S ribosomal protein L29 [Thermoanaerobaculia bacterium]
MKGTTVETMKGWSADERGVKLREWTQALFNLRLQKATGQLENPLKIRQLRRDIARLKTAERQAR